MKGAENPNKVPHLVRQNMDLFRELYWDILTKEFKDNIKELPPPSSGKQFVTDQTKESIRKMLNGFPEHFLVNYAKLAGKLLAKQPHSNSTPKHEWIGSSTTNDKEQVINQLIENHLWGTSLNKTFESINRRTSMIHFVTGFFSAGAIKSFRYAYEKVQKNKRK